MIRVLSIKYITNVTRLSSLESPYFHSMSSRRNSASMRPKIHWSYWRLSLSSTLLQVSSATPVNWENRSFRTYQNRLQQVLRPDEHHLRFCFLYDTCKLYMHAATLTDSNSPTWLRNTFELFWQLRTSSHQQGQRGSCRYPCCPTLFNGTVTLRHWLFQAIGRLFWIERLI